MVKKRIFIIDYTSFDAKAMLSESVECNECEAAAWCEDPGMPPSGDDMMAMWRLHDGYTRVMTLIHHN